MLTAATGPCINAPDSGEEQGGQTACPDLPMSKWLSPVQVSLQMLAVKVNGCCVVPQRLAIL